MGLKHLRIYMVLIWGWMVFIEAKDSPSLSHNFSPSSHFLSPSSADGLINFYRNLIFQRNYKKIYSKNACINEILAKCKHIEDMEVAAECLRYWRTVHKEDCPKHKNDRL